VGERVKPIRKQIAPGLLLSYLEASPDHGEPELSVIQGRVVTVLAVGQRARELFREMTTEEAVALSGLLEEKSAEWD